jgi:FKBP-type peptidyl-prolyl cis-trans isomerase FkpA
MTMPTAKTLAAALTLAAAAAFAQDGPLKAAAGEPNAVVTASGLVYRALQEGTGPSPAATDTVKVHYRGTFPDGREFDSSHQRNAPATFPLNRVIKCWTEGLQRMKVGGKAMLTCPAAIAYGERGAGNGLIPPNAVLRFEVELLGVNP